VSALPWDQRLARPVARALARTPVTPNQVTTFGVLCGLAAGALFAQGDAMLANLAAPLFMVAAFTDHVDGELARMTERTSRFGHYYDHFGTAMSYVVMFLGVGAGLRGGPLGDWTVLLGFLAGASVATIFSVRLGMEQAHGKTITRQPIFAGFEPEDTLYVVGPVTWAGALQPFLVAAGIGAPLFLLWVLGQWLRARRAARPDGGRP
jgi:phosphatidylglycerophosphate synthase